MKLEQVLSILKRKTGKAWYGNNSNRRTALRFDISNRLKPSISINEDQVKPSYVFDLASKFNKRSDADPKKMWNSIEQKKKVMLLDLISKEQVLSDKEVDILFTTTDESFVLLILNALEKTSKDFRHRAGIYSCLINNNFLSGEVLDKVVRSTGSDTSDWNWLYYNPNLLQKTVEYCSKIYKEKYYNENEREALRNNSNLSSEFLDELFKSSEDFDEKREDEDDIYMYELAAAAAYIAKEDGWEYDAEHDEYVSALNYVIESIEASGFSKEELYEAAKTGVLPGNLDPGFDIVDTDGLQKSKKIDYTFMID